MSCTTHHICDCHQELLDQARRELDVQKTLLRKRDLQLRKYMDALEYYADEDHFGPDHADIARRALG